MIAGSSPRNRARVLVTGASGFIGAHVSQALCRLGTDVHVCQRTSSSHITEPPADLPTVHHLDLTDAKAVLDLFANVKPNFVVHATTWRPKNGNTERLAMVQTNVIGANNLIEAASRQPPEKFIYLGSSLEYGHHTEPLHEDMLPAPTTLHGASKASATMLFQQAARKEEFESIILRLFSVYGPGEPRSRLIPVAIRAIRDGIPIELTAPGIRRDFVFVDDVVEAITMAMGSSLASGEILNVGTGTQTSNETLVNMIAFLMRRPADLVIGTYPARETDTSHWVADVRRCEERLGWRAKHNLESGLRETIDWFLDHDEI